MAIINGRGRVGIRRPSAVSALILDTYSGAAVAYSLRKLSNTYSGSLIRVRRSSDNTEQNIGFDASGNLDSSSLTSFVGAGNNGFVTTWYDQSGNGRNIVQTTASAQPQIVNNGNLVTKNGKIAISFDGNDFLRCEQKIINNIAISVFTVFSTNSLTNRVWVWDFGTNNFWGFYGFDINTYLTSGQKFGFYTSNSANDSDKSTNLNQNLSSIVSNTTIGGNIISNTSYYINNSQSTLTIKSGNLTFADFSSATKFSIGCSNTTDAYFSGQLQEIIVYPNNKLTNLSNINTSINTYYSIY